MRGKHVIWDWNGTLLDDFAITAQITIDAMADLGRTGLTPDDIRLHYQRPLSFYFSALLGRTAEPHELRHLGDAYVARYDAAMRDLPLAADSIHALEALAPSASQSLLSMAPDAQIALLIDHHGLREHFTLVQGFAGTGHPTKTESLVAHCAEIGIAMNSAWLVGDTVDDFNAASALGIRPVLVTTGMQSRQHLLDTGAPVVGSLAEAAQFILSA